MSSQSLGSDIEADWCVVHERISVETVARESSVSEPVLDDSSAAIALASLMTKKITREELGFFDHEERLLDLYVEVGTCSETFKEHHAQGRPNCRLIRLL
jgi:hypothetical protein